MLDEHIKQVTNWRPWVKSAIFSDLFVDDIIQDCLVKLWKNYDNIKNRSKGESISYIRHIVKNTTFDFIRRQKKLSTTISFDFVNEDILYENEYDDRIEDVERCLKFLPKNQLLIIQKRDNEMSFQEISDELGVNINTVLGRFRYARMNIQHMIDDPSYRPPGTQYRKSSKSKYKITKP